ncbi:signal peptidase II [bacterium]|nr:signal peptidase II [bacterium]
MIGNRLLYLIISFSIIILDQVTKFQIRSILSAGEIIRPFDNDLIWIVLVMNPGFAFGMRFLPSVIIAIINIAAIAGISIYLYKHPDLKFFQGLPFALITGGAIGNLADRLRFGAVVDFLSVDLPDWLMVRFPTFNVADSAVTTGVFLLLIMSFLFKDEK